MKQRAETKPSNYGKLNRGVKQFPSIPECFIPGISVSPVTGHVSCLREQVLFMLFERRFPIDKIMQIEISFL